MTSRVIALTGKARCGKNTFAQMLIKDAGEGKEFAFADTLRASIIGDEEGQVPEHLTEFYERLNQAVTDFNAGQRTSDIEMFTRDFPGFEKFCDDVGSGKRPFSIISNPAPSDIVYTNDSALKATPQDSLGGLSIRELLQGFGMFTRATKGEDFFIRETFRQIDDYLAENPNAIIVLTDARLPNEIEALRERSDTTIAHIQNPKNTQALEGATAQHITERPIAPAPGEKLVVNSGNLYGLQMTAKAFLNNEPSPNIHTVPHVSAREWKAVNDKHIEDFQKSGAGSGEDAYIEYCKDTPPPPMPTALLLEKAAKAVDMESSLPLPFMWAQQWALHKACDLLVDPGSDPAFSEAGKVFSSVSWPALLEDAAEQLKNASANNPSLTPKEQVIVSIAQTLLIQATDQQRCLGQTGAVKNPTEAIIFGLRHEYPNLNHTDWAQTSAAVDWSCETQGGTGGCSMVYADAQRQFPPDAALDIMFTALHEDGFCAEFDTESTTEAILRENFKEHQEEWLMPSRSAQYSTSCSM